MNEGLELPDPVILEWPNPYLADLPTISTNPETKYNTIIVKGTDGQGTYFTSVAQSTYAKTGASQTIEYYEENADCTTQELTDSRAAELLDFYQNIPYTIKATLIKRFDLKLYQRIKFDTGFPAELLRLTDTSQGVSHLRIISITYTVENNNNAVEITAISDKPNNILLAHQGFGSFTTVDNTQVIADQKIQSNIPYPYLGTVTAIAQDGKTCTVQTEDGKTITARII